MLTNAPIVPYLPAAEYDLPGLQTVNGIATGGGAKTAWFKDSEGNILAVSHRISS